MIGKRQFQNRSCGEDTISAVFLLISVAIIIASTLALASCGATGSGATGVKYDAKNESVTETGDDDVTSVMLESARGMMNDDSSSEQPIEPVGRVKVGDTGDAEQELGCSLTLLTPEGAIAADSISTATTANDDGTVELILNANNAAAFSSVNVEIRFDTSNFNPVKWAVGAMFDAGACLPGAIGADRGGNGIAYGVGEKGILELGSPGSTTGGSTYLGAAMRGADHLGVAVARLRPDLNGELSGSGELARVVFERKPYANTRSTSADDYEPARTPADFWDWDYGVVFPRGNEGNYSCLTIFSLRLPGDADFDYEVSIADITPIAQNYLKTIYWYGRKIPFDAEALKNDRFMQVAYPDLDKDGEVGISDITEIVYAYGRKYEWSKLAYRTPGHDWIPVDVGQSTGSGIRSLVDSFKRDPVQGISLPYLSLAPFDLTTYDYGILYENSQTGLKGVIPFAKWDLNLYKRDGYINSVTFSTESGELIVDMDFPGDADHNDNCVGVPDVSAIAANLPIEMTDENMASFLAERYRKDFCALFPSDDSTFSSFKYWNMAGVINSFVYADYMLELTGMTIDYYPTSSATSPFHSEFRTLNRVFYRNEFENKPYLPDELNFYPDEKLESASTRVFRTMPLRYSEPVCLSIRLEFNDDTHSVWPERILIE